MTQAADIYRLEGDPRSRVKLSDAVLHRLTDLILVRALRPGDSLPSESELARSFDVSKPVIREALRQLAVMGVVEIRQGRPSCISQLSAKPLELYLRLAVRAQPEGLREALELRRALETQIVVLAAERWNEDHLEALRGALGQMERNKDGHQEWIAADLAFHKALAVASGNILLSLLIEAMTGTMEDTIRVLHSQYDVRDAEATYARHVAIVDAVAARDTERARGAMEAHFDVGLPVVLRILGEDQRRHWR
jgi:GntR family transcriptional repressor for pyruvate dehydrogenase complex